MGDISIYGRIISKWILKIDVVDLIHLAQNRVKLWAFVNRVTNLQVSQKEGNFLISFSRKTLLQSEILK